MNQINGYLRRGLHLERFDPSRRLIEPRIWIYAGYVANQVMEHGLPEVSSQETTSSEPDHIYMVGQAYPLSPAKQYKPKDETIAESYSESYVKTIMYMTGLLCVLHIMMTVWKVYYLVTFL